MTTPRTYKHLAVLDFEATCEDKTADSEFDLKLQEIIEVPVGLISLEELAVVDSFNAFARPTIQPKLTEFCTELTSISQADVDAADTIDVVMQRLNDWLVEHGAEHDTLFATCGDWDLHKMWPKQVQLNQKILVPGYFKSWCNLKAVFKDHTGIKPKGMMHMLKALDIEHQGHHHRGADDVGNLCNIAIRLLQDGVDFQVTSDGLRR